MRCGYGVQKLIFRIMLELDKLHTKKRTNEEKIGKKSCQGRALRVLLKVKGSSLVKAWTFSFSFFLPDIKTNHNDCF